MDIETKVSELFKSINELATVLVEKKGYDGHFMTNSAYPDKLADSIKRYLFESLLGSEKGIAKGFVLSTYLKWNEDDDQQNVTAWFKVALDAQYRFFIREIEIRTNGAYLQTKQCLTITPRNDYDIPAKDFAVKMLKREVKHRPRTRFRMGP